MFTNNGNYGIVIDIIDAIHENASYLSEIDGKTGDGDHGVNMDKGFQLAKTRITEDNTFAEALSILGRTLVMDIGGSMGPIYGTFFGTMSKSLKEKGTIVIYDMYNALNTSLFSLKELTAAREGDKTLIDTLSPAVDNMEYAINNNLSDKEILDALEEGAKAGKDSTREMVAKVGRASRLGERSKGFLDAGATSCYIIINAMVNTIKDII